MAASQRQHRKLARNSNVQHSGATNAFRRHLWHGPVGPMLLVLGALLVYQVATSIQLARGQQTSVSGGDKPSPPLPPRSESDNVVAINEQSAKAKLLKQHEQQAINSSGNSATNNKLTCDYDKGQWNDCQPDGSQTKVMLLKRGNRECKANKTIRRDCEAVGCKYARGQWSSVCVDGQRFRLDTLVERIEPARGDMGGQKELTAVCKPSRRVTKDCRRTCHYLKSAWSECSNGFRTRTLTLATHENGGPNQPAGGGAALLTSIGNNKQPATVLPAAGDQRERAPTNQEAQCAPRKLIRRACHSAATGRRTGAATAAAAPVPANETLLPPPLPTANMTPAQRRRLKQQQQLKQQQHHSRTASKSSGTTTPTTTTTGSSSTKPTPTKDKRR